MGTSGQHFRVSTEGHTENRVLHHHEIILERGRGGGGGGGGGVREGVSEGESVSERVRITYDHKNPGFRQL